MQLGTDYALARLTGVNSYTGPTIVALSPSYTYNNRAQIDGIQTGSAVTVALNPGWGNHRLSGSGSLGAVVVEPSGSCSSATDVNCNQLSPGQSDGSATGQMTTAGLQMKSNTRLILQLNGAIPGSGYDQLVVNGAVDFAGGPRLDVFLGYVPALGQVFRIVDNGGGAAVVGSFAGLAEGATLTSSYSVVLQVSYAGGDGNDVTLTATSVPKIWTGAVNGLWSEPGNWTGGVPGAGDVLQFPVSASSKSMTNDLFAGTVFNRIEWYGTGYTIIGNAFGLTNGISNSGTNTISVAVALSGGTASGGSLTFSGAMTLSGNVSVTGALNGAVTLTGNAKISGTVTGPVDLGANTLSLASGLISGAISGTGGVQLGTDYALARLTGVNSYTGPTIVALSPSYTYNNRAQIDGIQTGSAVTVALNPGWGNHRLSGSGSLGAVVVEPSGSCSSATDVNCNQLSPGQSDGSATGQMTTAGLQMKSNTRLILQLNGAIPGSGYDQLVVNGAVDFAGGPRLDATLQIGVVPANGQIFVLIQNDGTDAVVGTFSGLPEGATINLGPYPFEISYVGKTGNDVVLISLSGDPLNEAPVANSDGYSTGFETQLVVAAPGVLGNDTDADLDVLTVISSSLLSAAGGAVVVDADGAFTYSPPAGFSGDDTFTYVISDGHDATDIGTVTVTVGAQPVDTTPPSAPGAVTSTSHVAGVPAAISTIDFAWGAATDAESGVDGYSVVIDAALTSPCATVKDVEEGTLSMSSAPLADGSWYVHVCAVDNAGNWGAVTDAGPFVVDATAPAADGLLYFSNFLTGDLRRMSVNGTGEVVLVAGENVPLAVEVDGVHGKLYWGTAAEIRRSNLDGTNVESVAAVATAGYAITLDPFADRLYWIDNSGAGAVRVAALDGSGAADLVLGGHRRHRPRRSTVRPASSTGRRTTVSPTSRLMRCDLDGTDVEVVFATATGIDGIATDPAAARLLYSALAAGEIRAVGDDGTGDTAIVATGAYPRELSFDRLSQHLYWAEEGAQSLRRARADGTDAMTLGVGTFGIALLTTGDSTPPTDPTFDSTSPLASTWSNDNTVEVAWSGAADEVDGSGLAGLLDRVEYDATLDSGHRRRPGPHCRPALHDLAGARRRQRPLLPPLDLRQRRQLHGGRACGAVLDRYDRAGRAGRGHELEPRSDGDTGLRRHDRRRLGRGERHPLRSRELQLRLRRQSDRQLRGRLDGEPRRRRAVRSRTAATMSTSARSTSPATPARRSTADRTSSTPSVRPAWWSARPATASSTWSNDNGVDFEFSGATDANGVAGYAVVYDQSRGTEPACATTQAGATFTGSSSPDGNDWWIHVRPIDAGNNCGGTSTFGPFWIDTAAPGAPGAVSSSSHDGGSTNDPTIDVAWGAATDVLSGIDGYSFFWNGVDQDCDFTIDSDFDERSTTSPPLAAGSWYFHVCAVDLAGNWGAVATGGPYTIDLSAPRVTNLDSVATSGGAIGEGEVVNVEITQLLVSFDEAMDATLAESSGNYLLIFGGNDGTLDTAALRSAAGRRPERQHRLGDLRRPDEHL